MKNFLYKMIHLKTIEKKFFLTKTKQFNLIIFQKISL